MYGVVIMRSFDCSHRQQDVGTALQTTPTTTEQQLSNQPSIKKNKLVYK
jgi:hypothetical protein